MNGLRIAASDVEGEVTELMVAEQTYSAARVPLTVDHADRTLYVSATNKGLLELQFGGLEVDGTDAATTSAAFSRPQSTVGSLYRAESGINGQGTNNNEEDDDADEITSDDSGDFEALTAALDDAAGYDLVRGLVAFDKQQVREIAALLAECGQLEEKQSHLWRRAVMATQSRLRSGKQHRRRLYGNDAAGDSGATAAAGDDGDDDIGAAARLGSPTVAKVEVIDEDLDEFEDVWLNTDRSCRYADPSRSYLQAHPYRYAEPGATGEFTTVFEGGFLFRAVTAEGAWIFFNDSEKYTMQVKYRFGATSTVAAGPNARLTKLPSGEIEVEVAVAPEETQVLIYGEVNGFRSLSVASPVPESYHNVHVERHNAPILEELQALCTRTGASALKYLRPSDALLACREEVVVDSAGNGSSSANQNSSCAYIDPEFPPCTASLRREGTDEPFLWSEPWRRPAEYMSPADAAELRLFRGQVLPSDPCPGDGGDVYLCSAAAILAEYPMWVRALFRYPLEEAAKAAAADAATNTTAASPACPRPSRKALARVASREAKAERRAHAYRVTLSRGGWWWSTVLDDYLPASRAGPAFARCEDDLRKLWVPLLEKAYAKAHGSYAAIQCGDVAEALQDLTGLPCSRFDEDWAQAADSESDRNHLFTRLRTHTERGNIVCLSLPDEGPAGGRVASMGLTYGMSYYVLDMVEYRSFDAARTYRLVQLRCPTVKPGWEGKWCSQSDLWVEEPALQLRCHKVGGNSPPHGMSTSGGALNEVWLDWATEVVPIFDGGAVCHARSGCHDYRVRGEFTDGVPSVALEVEIAAGVGPVEMVCMLSQPDDRCSEPGGAALALSPLMLCVSRPALTGPGRGAGASATTGGSVKASVTAARRSSRAGVTPAVAAAQRPQVVHRVCSTDPDTPTEKLNFIVGRDVALRYVFEPQPSTEMAATAPGCESGDNSNEMDSYVYYVIPRARGAMQGKAFTIGLLSSRTIDNESVQVRFVKPSERCEVFRNRREFGPERMAIPVDSVNYQVREPTGIVTTRWGTHIEPAP